MIQKIKCENCGKESEQTTYEKSEVTYATTPLGWLVGYRYEDSFLLCSHKCATEHNKKEAQIYVPEKRKPGRPKKKIIYARRDGSIPLTAEGVSGDDCLCGNEATLNGYITDNLKKTHKIVYVD